MKKDTVPEEETIRPLEAKRTRLNDVTAVVREPENLPEAVNEPGPPLWSSGQSFWLQIQRS
jgi:hypothetical protein